MQGYPPVLFRKDRSGLYKLINNTQIKLVSAWFANARNARVLTINVLTTQIPILPYVGLSTEANLPTSFIDRLSTKACPNHTSTEVSQNMISNHKAWDKTSAIAPRRFYTIGTS